MDTKRTTSVLVAAGLVGGYAAARLSHMRWLGSLVMSSAGAAAGKQWAKDSPARAVGLGSVYSGAFALAFPLAKRIGTVPAVAAMAAVAGGAAWLLHDRTAGEPDALTALEYEPTELNAV